MSIPNTDPFDNFNPTTTPVSADPSTSEPTNPVEVVQDGIRKIFAPETNTVLVQPDFSQLELHTAAHLAVEAATKVDTPPTTAVTPTVGEVAIAVADAENIARVLRDFANTLDILVAKAVSKPVATTPGVAQVAVTEASTRGLSASDKKILTKLSKHKNKFVSTFVLEDTANLFGYGSVSSAVSRIRRLGFNVVSAQQARKAGEKIKKDTTGYRLNNSES